MTLGRRGDFDGKCPKCRIGEILDGIMAATQNKLRSIFANYDATMREAIESGSTTADIYSFGNKLAPRGARPQQDFNVEKFDSIVGLMSLMSYTNHYHGNTEEKK